MRDGPRKHTMHVGTSHTGIEKLKNGKEEEDGEMAWKRRAR